MTKRRAFDSKSCQIISSSVGLTKSSAFASKPCQNISKAKFLRLKLLQIFARDVLLMKKLEIEKTKPTFIISTFKTDVIKVGLVFSISNFFIAKTSLANIWRSFSSSYLALLRANKTAI